MGVIAHAIIVGIKGALWWETITDKIDVVVLCTNIICPQLLHVGRNTHTISIVLLLLHGMEHSYKYKLPCSMVYLLLS